MFHSIHFWSYYFIALVAAIFVCHRLWREKRLADQAVAALALLPLLLRILLLR